MRRIKSTATRVALSTGVLAGLGIAMATSATAGPESGTLTVSPTTFTKDQSAGAGGDGCPNGTVNLYLNGDLYVPDIATGDDGGFGITLFGAVLDAGDHTLTGECRSADGATLRFAYAGVTFTVTEGAATSVEVPTTGEVPTTVDAVPTTTAGPVTSSTDGPSVTATTVSGTIVAADSPTTAVLAARSLPATGANEDRSLAIAIALLVVGGTAVVVGRRKVGATDAEG